MGQKINSYVTSCYRIMLGIKHLDKFSNAEGYTRVNEQPLLLMVQKRELVWIGHESNNLGIGLNSLMTNRDH